MSPVPVEHSKLYDPIHCVAQCLEMSETQKERRRRELWRIKGATAAAAAPRTLGTISPFTSPAYPLTVVRISLAARLPSSANSLLLVALEPTSRFSLAPNSISASSASNPLPASVRPRIRFPELVLREFPSRYSSASNFLPASRRPRTHLPVLVGPRIVFA